MTLIVNGFNIECATSPPIWVTSADKVIVSLAGNTQNALKVGTAYVLESGEDELIAAGTVTITAAGDGIAAETRFSMASTTAISMSKPYFGGTMRFLQGSNSRSDPGCQEHLR